MGRKAPKWYLTTSQQTFPSKVAITAGEKSIACIVPSLSKEIAIAAIPQKSIMKIIAHTTFTRQKGDNKDVSREALFLKSNGPEVKNVSKTLFFTLCSRANDPQFDDEIATYVLNKNPELKAYSPSLITQKLITHRARTFDFRVQSMKKIHPQSSIGLINLGGGLCSRFKRLEKEITHSIHLDLPEVIELLIQTFPETATHLVAEDLNQSTWIKKVSPLIGAEEIPVFTMEGVSMYLKKNAVLNLLSSLPKHFPRGYIILDLLHPFFHNKSYLIREVANVQASFYSGIKNTKEITSFCPTLNLVKTRAPFAPKGMPEIFPFNLYQFTTFSWGF